MPTTFICKCGKTFTKNSKAETTGYSITDFSERHSCYGCPYIVNKRDWKTGEIVIQECRATSKITYHTRCKIGTADKDYTACHLYSLDLVFVRRVLEFVNSLDGVEQIHKIPDEWRPADFGQCYSFNNCYGLAIFPLFFQKNKIGTEARRKVMNKFFSPDGYRKNSSEMQERMLVYELIAITKENALRKMT